MAKKIFFWEKQPLHDNAFPTILPGYQRLVLALPASGTRTTSVWYSHYQYLVLALPASGSRRTSGLVPIIMCEVVGKEVIKPFLLGYNKLTS